MNPQEEKEKIIWREKTQADIINELKNNKIFLQYLERTYPSGRESFINEYARKKVNWLEWGPRYVQWNETENLKWLDTATECLKEIQQKKLFDLQCLWRAEKVTIEQIRLTVDFDFWEDNILACPFIDPVNEKDMDWYIRYMQSSNYEKDEGYLDRWQDYEEIKEAYNTENANRNFPEWYEFHNGLTGLSVNLLLPDLRGPKEEFYMSLWRNEFHNKVKKEKEIMEQVAEILPQEVRQSAPWLNYHKDGWMTWFVNTFEDKETQEVFRKYGGEINFDQWDEYLENDLDVLANADKIQPIEGWYDWKEAIHKAAMKYRVEKIMDALPSAYQQYRINIDMGLGFETKNKHVEIDWIFRAK